MKKTGFVHNTIVLMIAMLITKIIGAAFKIPLANILGGTGMGYFSSAYGLFVPIFAITASGIPTGMVKLISNNVALGRYENAVKIKSTALYLFTVVGIIGTGVMVVLAKPFAFYFADSPKSYMSILIISPSVILCCLTGVYKGYYEGLRNMYPTALSQVFEAMARALFGLLIAYGVTVWCINQYNATGTVFGQVVYTPQSLESVYLPYSAAGAVLGVTISEIVALVTLLVRNRFSDGVCLADFATSQHLDSFSHIIKMLSKEIIPVAIGSVVGTFINFIDLLTVTKGINNSVALNTEYFLERYSFLARGEVALEELGLFMYGSYSGLTISLYMIIPALASMLDKSAFPNITAAWARGDRKNLIRNINVVYRGTMMIGIPASFGCAALAQPILSLLYRGRINEIQVALPTFIALGIGGIFLMISGINLSVFYAIGRGDLPIKIMALGILVKWIGNRVLIPMPEINILGATISTILCYFIVFVVGIFTLKKVAKVELEFGEVFGKPIFGGIICSMVAYLSFELLKLNFSSNISTLISIGIGGVFYIISLILMGAFSISNIINRQKLNN